MTHQDTAQPTGRADRVAAACRQGLIEHLPLAGRDLAFAGVLHDLGSGAALTLAAGDESPRALATIAYALLLRAGAIAHEAGDSELADACIDALETIEPELAADPAVRQ